MDQLPQDNIPELSPSSPCLKAALLYAAKRWPVLPLWWPHKGCYACGRKECASAGKHPIPSLVPRGLLDATTDQARIRRWWQRYPHANVGVVAGQASGLMALDVDAKAGGLEALEELLDKYGRFPEGPISQTGGGGKHFFFAFAPGLINRVIAPGLELKANGYLVAPPSRHVSARSYQWEVEAGPELPLPPLPRWLLPEGGRKAFRLPETLPVGARYPNLFKFACSLRSKGFGGTKAGLPEGRSP